MRNLSSKTNKLNYNWLALAGIILLALALRVWGINFGLPYNYHFDETSYTGAALNLGRGQIGPQTNPTGFVNILFVEYLGYYFFGYLFKLFSSPSDFANLYRSDPSSFILMARFTSAILGTLTVLVIYHIGKIIHSRSAGIISAVLLSIAFLHVRDSHFAVPDVAVTFFICASILYILIFLQRKAVVFAYLSALSAGYAAATKWTAALVILPVLFVLIKQPLSKKEHCISIFSLIAGFIAGGFQLFIKPSIYINYILNEWQAVTAGNFDFWQIDTLPGWLFYIKTMIYGLGILLACVGLIGTISYTYSSIRNKNLFGLLTLTFPIIFFFFMGANRHYFARYVLPLIPFLTLFAGIFIHSVYLWGIIRRKKMSIYLVSVVIIVIGIFPFISDLRLNMLLTRNDTRTEAKEWIESNISEGEKIAIDWPILAPPLSTSEKPSPDSRRTYEVINFMEGAGLSDKPLNWYQENQIQYLIATSFIYQIPLANPEKNNRRKEFYNDLDSNLELIKEFSPSKDMAEPPFIFDEIYGPFISLWEREQPGPVIKVYVLK